jgi:hypothetical protein
MQATTRITIRLFLCMGFIIPIDGFGKEHDWSIGWYGGQYYDTEPAGIIRGNAKFIKQYLLAIHASRTVWISNSLPLSLDIDGMIGHQSGVANLHEIGITPVVRWDGFPWKEKLPTYLRLAPLGISYTTSVSPLERSPTGDGSRTLNLLFIEIGFSIPALSSEDIFVRLHHRCTIYDLLNDYGANGEDFLTLGYRYKF